MPIDYQASCDYEKRLFDKCFKISGCRLGDMIVMKIRILVIYIY